MAELRILANSKKLDILCITESHFSDELEDAEIQIPGFNMFMGNRNFKLDRTKKSVDASDKGGSVIYIRDNIFVVDNSYDQGIDSTSVIIECDIGKILIGCFYRSMSLNDAQNSEFLEYFSSKVSNYNNIEKLIFGDFNCPDVLWTTGNVVGPADSLNKSIVFQQNLLEKVHDAGMDWLITDEITRRRKFANTLQESSIDQIFLSADSLISEFSIFSPLGKSDHVSIISELNLFVPSNDHCHEIDDVKRNWAKCSLSDIFNLACNIDWEFSRDIESMSVEEVWKEVHGNLTKITDCIPPVDPVSSNKIDNYNMPWINSSLKRAVKAKNLAWTSFDANPTIDNLNYALSKQGVLNDVENKSKRKYEKLITSDLKHNSKAFYSYLRNRRNVKSMITVLRKDNGVLTENDSETAECLANAFSSVFVKEPHGPLPQDCYETCEQSIDNLIISEFDVYNELKSVDIYKSFGPDNVHPKLLRSLADNPSFVQCLTKLYSKCISNRCIPKIWKMANVVALHKKDSKLEPLNYRPVSLTCILCKIYEKFIRRHILNFVEGRINVNQHGFVNKKSCFSNLLETVDAVINMLESGCPVDIFYFDFSKAFDSVPHYRLLTRLENYGIKGSTLDIIRDFLSGRLLRTSVRGNYSSLKEVLSGVPQGSVLGPLLFVLFINDLPDHVKNVAKLFADDLKLVANASEKSEICKDLNVLEKWESTWLLKFNAAKCKVMHLNYNDNQNTDYFLDGVLLKNVDEEKDLGMFVSSELSWKKNIHSCIKAANRAIGWVSRNVIERDTTILSNIYKSIIRPKLEYCVQIWSPAACYGNWSLILELESIQRRFTRLCNDIGMLPYSKRLEIMKLTTLGERRIRGDLIETYKIVNSKVDYGKDVFKLSRSGNNIVSKIKNGATCSKSVCKLRLAFLPERIRNYWNNLPVSVKNSRDINDFKSNFEIFKTNCNSSHDNNYWEVSNLIIEKIEGSNYLANKEKFNRYLLENPFVARKKGINTYISTST